MLETDVKIRKEVATRLGDGVAGERILGVEMIDVVGIQQVVDAQLQRNILPHRKAGDKVEGRVAVGGGLAAGWCYPILFIYQVQGAFHK